MVTEVSGLSSCRAEERMGGPSTSRSRHVPNSPISLGFLDSRSARRTRQYEAVPRSWFLLVSCPRAGAGGAAPRSLGGASWRPSRRLGSRFAG
jgi:hypothetical protein